MDEFQQITHYSNRQAEAVFRAWVQEFPNLRFIFSGSQRNLMTAMFVEANRPLYRSAQHMHLQAIALPAYQSFIQGHFSAAGKSISDDLIAQVYQWARGQTYLVQLVCNELYAREADPQAAELPALYQKLIEREAPVFAAMVKLLSDGPWQLLKAIAKEGQVQQVLSQAFRQKYQLAAPSSLQSHLAKLIDKELVIEEEQGYRVHEVLLEHWLAGLT